MRKYFVFQCIFSYVDDLAVSHVTQFNSCAKVEGKDAPNSRIEFFNLTKKTALKTNLKPRKKILSYDVKFELVRLLNIILCDQQKTKKN